MYSSLKWIVKQINDNQVILETNNYGFEISLITNKEINLKVNDVLQVYTSLLNNEYAAKIIIIGATSLIYQITTPLLNRFLSKIIKKLSTNYQLNFSNEICQYLAKFCRYNTRNVINFFKRIYYYLLIYDIFQNKPKELDSISQVINEPVLTITNIIELFLIKEGYLLKTK
ncbi:MAG: hypothetical protein LBS95_00910 [Mycoplasmataceae bacterium]|jgi:Holliday junction resolvasome RuvABC ATP-dependent DNA helicase subunit|nr:hypothetical protein [Mycoplasmataceae bacterium]